MTSPWTHRICVGCWNEKNPENKINEPPFPYVNPQEFCCYCESETYAGIYVRDDPKDLICGGDHKENEEEKFRCPSCMGYFFDEEIVNHGECISCRMASED